MWDERPRHSDAECARLLERLLLEPAELLAVLAPEGWERSLLRHTFHPTPEQIAAERERFRRSLASLSGEQESADADVPDGVRDRLDAQTDDPDDVPAEPVDAELEVVELLGHALWDLFCENNRVIDAEGRAYDLGSFRGSAGFIAESINRRYSELRRSYDYLDFYMGSAWIAGRADLRPVYRWIFGRLREEGCRWIYSFPRLYLIDFGGKASSDDLESYDPSEAVRAELEEAERTEQVQEFDEQLDRAYEEDLHAARDAPLPATVAAYREVYGHLPEGWPHPEM